MSAPGSAAARAPVRRPQLLALMAPIALVVLVADQLSKSWAIANLAHRSVPLFWTLRLDLSFNDGLAFSQGRGLTGLITLVGVGLVLGLLWWATRITQPLLAVALALLVGGACGNLFDRIFRDHDGAVIDFIDFQWWPVFNVADIGITMGAILMILGSLRDPGAEAPPTPAEPAP